MLAAARLDELLAEVVRVARRGNGGRGLVALVAWLVASAAAAGPTPPRLELSPLREAGRKPAGARPVTSLAPVGRALRSRAVEVRARRRRALTRAALGPAQRDALEALRVRVGSSLRARFREGAGTPRQLAGRVLERRRAGAGDGRAGDLATAAAFLRRNRALLRLADPEEELALRDWRRDALGRRHLRYEQRHRGLRVWPAELIVHLDPDGHVDLLDGAFVSTPHEVPERPRLSARAARARARAGVGGEERGPSPEPAELLVHAPGDRPARLAWRVRLLLDLTSDCDVLVDATTGDLLLVHPLVRTAPVAGSGVDLFGVTRPLGVWQEGGTHYLVDASKPMFDPASDPPDPSTTVGGLVVMDAQNQPPTADPGFLPPLAHVTAVDPTAWSPADAVSAAFSLSETYDYFLERHGRDSLDGAGGTVLAAVRLGLGFQNAFWSGSLGLMAFGDGEPFAGALDVVAHEATHAVIETGAGLIYQNQPGAANEALSDIFGEMVEARTGGATDWQLGSSLSAPLRSLSDPGSLEICCGRPYPSRMSEFIAPDDPFLDLFQDRDHGGVHFNSTILGHAFYLLAEGLPVAIGLADAAAIFYRALDVHLVANSRFVDVRLAAIRSADELFGPGSSRSLATEAAFDAVEIFDGAGTPLPSEFPPVAGSDALLFARAESLPGPEHLERSDPSLGDPPAGLRLSQGGAGPRRPSITGDGSEVWFIDDQDDLCVLATAADAGDPAEAELCLGDPQLRFQSVAVSRDGRFVAVVPRDPLQPGSPPQPSITLFDQAPGGVDRSFDLAALTNDGPGLTNVLYADAMSFRAAGDFLLFDALNALPLASGGALELWSIYALDLASGELLTLVPPLVGFDFGFPALSQTSDDFLLFDAVDVLFGLDYVSVANLTTGEVEILDVVFGHGTAPSYTGDDGAVVFSVGDLSATGFSLWRIPLAGDRITPAGPSAPLLADARFGLVYRRGPWQGPPPDRDLDGIEDGADNCPDEPNADQSDVGGVGVGSAADGIGDACQCGDVRPDGRLTPLDAGDLRLELSGAPAAGFAAQKCSTIGGVECDLADLIVLRRVLAGLAPPVAPVCAAAVP